METKYIIIGNSRSGKTTVGEKLRKEVGGDYVDVVDYVYRFILRENVSQTESNPDLLITPYEELCRDLAGGKNWNILELASDFPDIFLPKILSFSKSPVKIIFCACPLKICLQRNKKEARQVPEKIIQRQNKYGEHFYRRLANNLCVELSVLDTGSVPR